MAILMQETPIKYTKYLAGGNTKRLGSDNYLEATLKLR